MQRAVSAAGFSLIEMAVTLSIFAILVAAGVPTMRTWVNNNRVRAVTDTLQDGLRLAKAEALRSSRQVVFALTNSTTPGVIPLPALANGTSWAIYTIPSMTDGSELPTLVQAGVLSNASANVVVNSNGVAALCFNSVGRLITNSSASVTAVTGGATCSQADRWHTARAAIQHLDDRLGSAIAGRRGLGRPGAYVRSALRPVRLEPGGVLGVAACGSRRRMRRSQRGIALFECLIALLIFSVGVLGLMGLEARVISVSTASEDRGRASLLAGEIASNMWLNDTVSPTTAAYTALLASANDMTHGGLPNGVATVVQVAGTTNAADITITWRPPTDPAGTHRTLTTRIVLP